MAGALDLTAVDERRTEFLHDYWSTLSRLRCPITCRSQAPRAAERTLNNGRVGRNCSRHRVLGGRILGLRVV